MANTYKRSPKVSMLVTAIEGKLYMEAIDQSILFAKSDMQSNKQLK